MRSFARYEPGRNCAIVAQVSNVPHIVTCGSSSDANGDPDSRLFVSKPSVLEISKGDEASFECLYKPPKALEEVSCVAAFKEGYVVAVNFDGGLDAEVRVLSLSGECQSTLLATGSMGIRAVNVSPDGLWAACSREIGGVTVVKIANQEDFKAVVPTLEVPVKYAAFDPKSELIAITAADGALRVVALAEPDAVWTVKNCFSKETMEISEHSPVFVNQPSWSPSGEFLAVGSGEGRVCVFKRGSWTTGKPSFELAHEPDSKLVNLRITATCFVDEDYLVACGLNPDGNKGSALFVFHLPSKKTVKKLILDAPAWTVSTLKNERGQLVVVLSLHTGLICVLNPMDLVAPAAEKEEGISQETSVTLIKKASDASSPSKKPASKDAEEEEDDDEVEGEAHRGGSRRSRSTYTSLTRFEREAIKASRRVHVNNTYDPRKPRSLLAWNEVGRIIKRQGFVDVDYTAYDHQIGNTALVAPFDYDLGCISSAGVLLGVSGTPRGEEEEEPERALVKFHPCDPLEKGWGPAVLEKDEKILLMASGSEISVLYTSKEILRVYRTRAGLQQAVVCAPPGLVAAVAVDARVLLLRQGEGGVVTHALWDFGPDYNPIRPARVLSEASVQLLLDTNSGPEEDRAIQWAGIRVVGDGDRPMAAFLTTKNVLMVLFENLWVPAIELKRHQKVFPVFMDYATGELNAVKLDKKSDVFVVETPVPPVPSAFAFRLPLLSHATSLAGANSAAFKALEDREQSALRHDLLATLQPEGDVKMAAKSDTDWMFIFLWAVEIKADAKAAVVFGRLRLPRAKEIALEKAQAMGASPQLLERLSEMMHESSPQEEEKEEEQDERRSNRVVMMGEEDEDEEPSPRARPMSARDQQPLDDDRDAKRRRRLDDEREDEADDRTPPNRNTAQQAPKPIPFLVSSSPIRDKRPTGLAGAFALGSPVKTPQLSRAAGARAKSTSAR